MPHRLLVLADVSRPLREEERQAWQRLIRVLGHELNNSLAPIQSIAGSLQRLAAQAEPPADWREDLRQRPRRHRVPRGGALPLHDRLREARPAAAAPARAGGRRRAAAPRRRRSRRAWPSA